MIKDYEILSYRVAANVSAILRIAKAKSVQAGAEGSSASSPVQPASLSELISKMTELRVTLMQLRIVAHTPHIRPPEGTFEKIKENEKTLLIEIAEKIKIKITRTSIARKVE